MSKKIFGIKSGGETVLLQVDTSTKITEYSLDGVTWTQTMLANATTEVAGLMSSTDKTKLDNLLVGYKGYYATSAALIFAHATGVDGDFASVGAADTLWAWDSDTSAWVNTDSNTINPTWESVTGKPTFATVATSGSYSDLSSKPTLITSYDDLTEKPIDLSNYGAESEGHYTRFGYSTGGIDEYTSACFHFDDSLVDSTGHITGGTVTGTTTYANGKFGNTFSFDGSTVLKYTKNQTYDGFTSSDKITCDFWINTTDTTASGASPFCKNGYDVNRFYFYLRSGVLSFEVYESGWVSFAIGSVSDGAWHHVTLTYDGTSSSALKTYLDGNLITSTTHSISSSEGEDGFIFGDYGFIGKVDELRFSKGIIRWTGNFTPPVLAYSTGISKALYVDSKSLEENISDVVASSETTVTSTYTADYDTATIHRIKTTASTACTLTVQDIPSGKSLIIRVDNSAAGSVSFGADECISTSQTGIKFLTFVNVTGTIEWVH